jgi:hypothetical protein
VSISGTDKLKMKDNNASFGGIVGVDVDEMR